MTSCCNFSDSIYSNSITSGNKISGLVFTGKEYPSGSILDGELEGVAPKVTY